MRKLFLFTMICSIFSGAVFSLADEYQDRVYAVVEDEVITLLDVRRQTNLMERQLMNQMPGGNLNSRVGELRRQAVEQMIHNELCYAEFKERGLDVPKAYIEERIDNIVKSEADGSYDKFEKTLEDDGMTMEEFRDQLKKQIASQLLLDQFVSRQVKVTPQEVEEYFQENKSDFSEDGRLKLAIIFLADNEGEDDDESGGLSLQERVRKVEKALEEGDDFADLAREYSDEQRSAERGGELGWLKMSECRKSFRQAVEDLNAGEVSEPVEDEEGVYFVKLLEKKEVEKTELTADIRKNIRGNLRQESQEKYYRQLVEKLEDKFYVKRYF